MIQYVLTPLLSRLFAAEVRERGRPGQPIITKHTRVSLHTNGSIPQFTLLTSGTDHQRIAKIDRENEVAPPPKVPLIVGQVCSSIHFRDIILILSIITGNDDRPRGKRPISERSSI